MNISVYITSYNQIDYLKLAIESVLAQTLPAQEIIIVDDCSQDESRDLIQAYQNQYPDQIRAIFHEKNTGVTQTRIDAIQSAQGEYITYVDGDDLYLPGKLEKEAQLIQKEACDLAFSNFYRFHEDPEEIISIWAGDRHQLPAFGNMHLEVFARMFPRNSLFRCELVHTSILKQTGLYDPQLEIYEDYELKIRMAALSKIAYTMEPLSKYRDNPKGLSKSKKALHYASFQYIYEKHAQELIRKYPSREKELKSRFDTFFKHLNPDTSRDWLTYQGIKQHAKRILKKIIP